MKKLILSLGALLIIMFCKAQSIPAGTVIWSEDFDSARWAQSVSPFDTNTLTGNVLISQDLMPDGWTVGDATGNSFYWHWSQLGPRGRYISYDDQNLLSSLVPSEDPSDMLASGSAANGVMMLESDYFNTNPQGEMVVTPIEMDSYIMTPSIDLSNRESIILKFEQKFRWCCSSTNKISVFVSFDYNPKNPEVAHWTEFSAKFDALVSTGSQPNPHIAKIDISQVAAGHESVYIKWAKIGAMHYIWMIDDVELIEPLEYNVNITNAFADYLFEAPTENFDRDFPGGYYSIPKNQLGGFTGFRAVVKNDGTETNMVRSNLQIFRNDNPNPMVNLFSAPKSIAGFHTDTLKIDGPLILPSFIGKYTVRFSATMDSMDMFPENNTLEKEFFVSDNLYSRTSDNKENMTDIASDNWIGADVDGAIIGSYYYLKNETGIYSVRFYFSENNDSVKVAAGDYYCKIHIFCGNANDIAYTSPLASSATYILQPSDLGQFLTIPFLDEGNLNLQPGPYYIALETNTSSPDGNGHTDFIIGQEKSSTQLFDNGWPIAALLDNDGAWGWVNANFSLALEVEYGGMPPQINFVANMNTAIQQQIFNPQVDTLFIIASFNSFGQSPLAFTALGDGLYSFVNHTQAGEIQFKLKTSTGLEEDTFRYCTITQDTSIQFYWNSPLDINKPALLDEFEIFPNPVSDLLSLKTNTLIQNVKVFNAFGKLVIQAGKDCRGLDVSELPAGIYVAEVTGENFVYRAKFLKK